MTVSVEASAPAAPAKRRSGRRAALRARCALAFGLALGAACATFAQTAGNVTPGRADRTSAPHSPTAPLTSAAAATDSRPKQPAYRLPRYEEDWSFLRDASERTGPWDKIKYIPLGKRRGWYLSLGGETRWTYERFRNPDFGDSPADDGGYLLQRHLFHADLHLGPRVRFFGQIKSGIETGRNGGPRPVDEDKFDVHEAFVDVVALARRDHSLSLRAGRQELAFGSGRLVALREGPNVPASFDGLRLTYLTGRWRIDGFATKLVETDRGFFDDGTDTSRTFWGAYAARPVGFIRGANIDAYYFGLDRRQVRFVQGSAREIRHTVGARVSGARGAWGYDYELIGQLGKFGDGDIRAWRAAAENSYALRATRYAPRLVLKADAASGDRDPRDPDLQTFNALFPSGVYSGKAGILGPPNAVELEPSVNFNPFERVSVSAGWGFFWRTSLRDGIYNIPGLPGRTGLLTDERYIGSRSIFEAAWQIDRHLSLNANYSYVFTTKFGTENPPGPRDLSYVGLWATYRF